MAHDYLEAVFPWADRPEREEFLDRYLNRAHYTHLPEEVKGENDEIQPTEI